VHDRYRRFNQNWTIPRFAYTTAPITLFHLRMKMPETIQKPTWWPECIVSGGQTGVDRAALDLAIELGIPHAGWCPKGRVAEDGPIDACYLLKELDSANYADRTRKNILDSDATLILYNGELQGGSYLTAQFAIQQNKPCLKLRLSHPGRRQRVREWLETHQVKRLNVAGPRASKEPIIYQRSLDYLRKLFQDSVS